MLSFEKVLELTFVEQKISKTGNVYVVIRFMSENGSTMDCMYKGDTPLSDLALRETYNFTFEYSVSGKFTKLVCKGIKEING